MIVTPIGGKRLKAMLIKMPERIHTALKIQAAQRRIPLQDWITTVLQREADKLDPQERGPN